MKILHVVPTYIPATRYGGPIYSVHGLCKALVGLDHEVYVFTTNVDGDQDSEVPLDQPVDHDGVKVRYFPSRHLRRIYYSPPMRRALNREISDFDLVHLHSIFLWPTWAAAREARSAKVPYIVSPRGMLIKDLVRRKSHVLKTVWLALIEKRNLETASAIHVTSTIEEQEVRKFGFKFPPFFSIPNGIDDYLSADRTPGRAELTRRLTEKGPYILFLGRINWKKGLDRLISALRYIPDMRLVIAGNDEEGYKGKLEMLAKENSVLDRIDFTGPVYGRDKDVYYNNASVFVLPSYSENFGNTVLEAMAAGCPVVVTPDVGASEIVENAGAGLVLDGKPEVLGRGINELLLNPGLLKNMSARGRKAVEENFTWDVIAKKMENVYKKILNV